MRLDLNPDERSSIIKTSSPLEIRCFTIWLPRKPAPPVTAILPIFAHLKFTVAVACSQVLLGSTARSAELLLLGIASVSNQDFGFFQPTSRQLDYLRSNHVGHLYTSCSQMVNPSLGLQYLTIHQRLFAPANQD